MALASQLASLRAWLLGLGAPLLLAAAAVAADGRIEINQTSVQSAGGFPFVITRSGSYVLTSDLVVAPAGATAVLIQSHDVSLDLNGFGIRGAHPCDPTSCLFGNGRGVEAGTVVTGGTAARTRLRNGSVRGFGLECVKLGTDAHVEGLTVSSCGDSGIAVGARGLVRGNHVSFTGVRGLALAATTGYSHNVIALFDLGPGPGASVQGGARGTGNVCDGGSCPGQRRRFYLTTVLYPGADADATGNCAAGFHFASLWEIRDTSALEYDGGLGHDLADSGAGPPAEFGWVRTGRGSGASNIPGAANCLAWTSADGLDRGTVVAPGPGSFLVTVWDSPAQHSSPWSSRTEQCNNSRRIWCVEN
jgi:hypothetical protein